MRNQSVTREPPVVVLPEIDDLVSMEKPREVLKEAENIVRLMFDETSFDFIRSVFDDILTLFAGKYPDFKRCNTRFHDLQHTTDAFLAMARLMHGAVVEGKPLNETDVFLGLIAALLHDTGYIQREDDHRGTGARYTLIHVQRSVEFMKLYFDSRGFSERDFKICSCFLECTDLDVEVCDICFSNESYRMLGQMLGTADLLGQMAARNYLEKLIFLYYEFEEAGVPGFASELDLLRKTADFYEMAKVRLDNDLNGVRHYVRAHFRERWNIDKDLYEAAIEKNVAYLRFILNEHPEEYRTYLRRALVKEWN
ncbi:hypothetical protein SAMN02745216_01556 [Desulfatibacillum alkenivorans DSM 16219]|uniref:HD/PDEase domain-containing protein n=1 Tax=Desulfatibacillum alkenivorans DSM 16219 TaxID=1121393 RepID=A0A1M6IXG6_9BACT|nr:hypothetical protein [Desulfatibacillum alkenivorans]SHJ39104.1 hypothetical protein SAMN02745216_01556 [Desulfatibacillum alkenivorans DSM 16219]